MADQVLALYGVGKGPRVPIRGKRARAKISGKPVGGPVVYHVETDEGVVALEFDAEGEHDLPAGDFVCVEHGGQSRALLCFVRTG